MIVQRTQQTATAPLSAMIIDGDGDSIRRLRSVLEDDPRIAVGCTVKTIATAVTQAGLHRPDVVFIDVGMGDGDGIAVARSLAPGRAIVVVSDRPDFAFDAYDFGAVDYLLKPVSTDRVRATLRRVGRFFHQDDVFPQDADAASSPDPLTAFRSVPIPSRLPGRRKATDLVPVSEVIWVESLQNYSIVQLPGRDRRSMKRSLTEWAALLPAGTFVRLGRSHLIQLAKLEAITSPARNEWLAHFRDVGQPLRLGRAAAGKLRAILRGASPASSPR